MSRLLDRGADANARAIDGTTALHWAVRADNLDGVDALLAAGADASARTGDAPAFVRPCKGTGCGSEGVGINRGGLPDRGRRGPSKSEHGARAP